MATSKGILYLIPVDIGGDINISIPPLVLDIALRLDEFIVENERTARRYLLAAGYKKEKLNDILFHVLNKHTSKDELPAFINSLKAGKNVGLLSEAGSPCIADPGQVIVGLAQQEGIMVKPLTGPNSMMLALMASGMNGQCFTFRGYLPIERTSRYQSIKDMESAAIKTGCTQIFMETPFRNNKLFDEVLKICKPGTKLCIGADLTMETEFIVTRTIAEWKKHRPDINKRPAIFLIYKP